MARRAWMGLTAGAMAFLTYPSVSAGAHTNGDWYATRFSKNPPQTANRIFRRAGIKRNRQREAAV